MSRAEIPGAEVLTGGGADARTSVAERLTALIAQSGAELYHDAAGDGYVRYVIGGHLETHPLGSRAVKRWLRKLLYDADHSEARAETITSVMLLLDAQAQYDGPEHETHLRVAGHEGRVYLDLCDADWRIVEVSARGWRIVSASDSPVRFRRARGMLALPSPVSGGTLEPLRKFANADGDGLVLLIAWLVGALCPRGPYPVLVLHGEAGSAKSTLARMLRSLIDPSSALLRAEPREVRDLMIAARNGWVIAIDNVSQIQRWMSDSLCQVSTGGALSTRKLYSDDEETILDAVRPVIVTGVEQVATRGDLLDRAIAVELAPIPEGSRQLEATLWDAYDRARPALLGALLDAVATALRRRASVQLDRLPRMADHAIWVVAAEPALPWGAGTYLEVYAGARVEAHQATLDAEPLAAPLALLLAEREEWSGTATELLAELARLSSERATRAKTWPESGRAVSGRLRYIAPSLRAIGVDYTPPRKTGRANRRVLELRRGARWGRDRSHRSHRSHDPETSGSAEDSGAEEASDASGRERSASDASDCAPGASDRVGDDRSRENARKNSGNAPTEGSASDASGRAPTTDPDRDRAGEQRGRSTPPVWGDA